MTTGVAGSNARQYHQQVLHYLRKGIDYTMKGTTVTVGTLPAGALINFPMSGVFVTQVFNGSANLLDIGASTDTGTNNFGSGLSLAAVGAVALDEGANISAVVAVDTTVQANVGVTGAPTTGTAEIVIYYVPDNDL